MKFWSKLEVTKDITNLTLLSSSFLSFSLTSSSLTSSSLLSSCLTSSCLTSSFLRSSSFLFSSPLSSSLFLLCCWLSSFCLLHSWVLQIKDTSFKYDSKELVWHFEVNYGLWHPHMMTNLSLNSTSLLSLSTHLHSLPCLLSQFSLPSPPPAPPLKFQNWICKTFILCWIMLKLKLKTFTMILHGFTVDKEKVCTYFFETLNTIALVFKTEQ